MAMMSHLQRPTILTKWRGNRTLEGMRDSMDRRPLRNVRFACVAVLVLVVVGFWANLPYIASEHRRLETWKAVGLWAGDLTAMLWFMRFAYVHAVLGRRFGRADAGDRREHIRFAAWSMAIALLVDLGMTLYLMHDERSGYQRGAITTAEVSAVVVHKRPEATVYDVQFRFVDATGSPHEALSRVRAENHRLSPRVPADVVAALAPTGQKAIRIRYDPKFPVRAWIDRLGWHDDNGIYWFSFGVLCLQAAITLVFVLILSSVARSQPGTNLWWSDTYKALPLAVEAFLMAAMGLVDRIMDALAG